MFLFKDDPPIENVRISDAATRLSVSNSTIRNWIKTGLLTSPTRGYVSNSSLKLAMSNLIGDSKLTSRANKSAKAQGDHELNKITTISRELHSDIWDDSLPQRYEQSLSESHKNKEGIFYTDKIVVTDMLKDTPIDDQTTFLDPCCGCGNFILEAIEKGIRVENIYGFDTDPIAIEITKKRIYHKTGRLAPNIICTDFLAIASSLDRKFDLIFTNPPWGKKLQKKQKEELSQLYKTGLNTDSCSLFAFASVQLLAKSGTLGFLLPESVLNIATFQPLRALLLSLSIRKIKNYGKAFDGIQSRAYSIIVKNLSPREYHQIQCVETEAHYRLQSSFMHNPNRIFNIWSTSEEQNTINKLLNLPHYSLKDNADWGLGIVTGDNKSKCKQLFEEGLVPIFRGKDITPNQLNAPTLYIDPDLSKYQQTASPSIYYADKKIIYRFISTHLVFFCDTKQSLILNSANALVLKKDFPISSEQLVSLLNSKIINWLFTKIFRTHKILRKDLEALPIYSNCYKNDTFDEETFLHNNQITYTNGTYSIKR